MYGVLWKVLYPGEAVEIDCIQQRVGAGRARRLVCVNGHNVVHSGTNDITVGPLAQYALRHLSFSRVLLLTTLRSAVARWRVTRSGSPPLSGVSHAVIVWGPLTL